MVEISNFQTVDIPWFLKNSKNIPTPEGGFYHVKKDDIKNLDDSNIYNSLLKTNQFLSGHFVNEFLKVTVAKKNGEYFVIVKRKIKNDYEIHKLFNGADNALMRHIDNIYNPLEMASKEIFESNLLSAMKTEFAPLFDANDSSTGVIEETYADMNTYKFKTYYPFLVDIHITELEHDHLGQKKKYRGGVRLNAENGGNYFTKVLHFNTASEFKRIIKEIVPIMKETIRTTRKKVPLIDLVSKKLDVETL